LYLGGGGSIISSIMAIVVPINNTAKPIRIIMAKIFKVA
jgi:hypothetical protein